jgi:RNA polymerase sigma factor (sigma-70 family)
MVRTKDEMPIEKCKHGVYVASNDKGRKLGTDISQGCSICQSIHPSLDTHYGIVTPPMPKPKGVDAAFALWKVDESPEAYGFLFQELRHLSRAIATDMFKNDPFLSDIWRDASEDAVTDFLLKSTNLHNRESFVSWATVCLRNWLKDWRDHQATDVLNLADSVDDQAHPMDIPDTHSDLDEKILLSEVKERLTPEELELFESVAAGETQAEIGIRLGIERRRVGEQYAALEAKIRHMVQ